MSKDKLKPGSEKHLSAMRKEQANIQRILAEVNFYTRYAYYDDSCVVVDILFNERFMLYANNETKTFANTVRRKYGLPLISSK